MRLAGLYDINGQIFRHNAGIRCVTICYEPMLENEVKTKTNTSAPEQSHAKQGEHLSVDHYAKDGSASTVSDGIEMSLIDKMGSRCP